MRKILNGILSLSLLLLTVLPIQAQVTEKEYVLEYLNPTVVETVDAKHNLKERKLATSGPVIALVRLNQIEKDHLKADKTSRPSSRTSCVR